MGIRVVPPRRSDRPADAAASVAFPPVRHVLCGESSGLLFRMVEYEPNVNVGRIASLYRYPVKGFSPERIASTELTAGNYFPCDRLYAVENGPSGFDPAAAAFVPKT